MGWREQQDLNIGGEQGISELSWQAARQETSQEADIPPAPSR
jgi:hypothetical protein